MRFKFSVLILTLALWSAFMKSRLSATPGEMTIDYPSQELGTNFPITFVTVGDPGNEHDPVTLHGAVKEPYRLGKKNITVQEYTTFLNHVAVEGDPYELYNTNMISDAIVHAITRTKTLPYHYEVVKGQEENPVTYVNWFCAARFCNWLQNGCGGPTTTEEGAYTMPPGVFVNTESVAINTSAVYFLPTPDQWYKATYFRGGPPDVGYFDLDSVLKPGWSGAYDIEDLGTVNGDPFIQWLSCDSGQYGPYSDREQNKLYDGEQPDFRANQLGFRIASVLKTRFTSQSQAESSDAPK